MMKYIKEIILINKYKWGFQRIMKINQPPLSLRTR